LPPALCRLGNYVAGSILFAVAAFLLCRHGVVIGAGRTWGGEPEFVCAPRRIPSTCVGNIASNSGRHGVILLWFEFIIGVDAVAAPMAGSQELTYSFSSLLMQWSDPLVLGHTLWFPSSVTSWITLHDTPPAVGHWGGLAGVPAWRIFFF